MLTIGHTSALVPPKENIHRVRIAGDGLAISIYVYEEDIGRHHSSINQCFDALPIRPTGDAAPRLASLSLGDAPVRRRRDSRQRERQRDSSVQERDDDVAA